MLSILSWKAPSDIPGGRINTQSWRLDRCNFFGINGHDETRWWPGCFVFPIRRVVYRTMWPRLLLDRWTRRVSSRALFCSAYFGLICIICTICIQLNLFTYCTYCAYDTNKSHLYLFWSEDAMNTDITPVQRDSRQAQRGVQCIMVFIKKTSNFIRKHRKHCILAHLASIAMQNHFPSQSMVTQVVTATSSQRVCNEASNLGSVPNVDSNACEIAAWLDGIWSASGRTLVPAVCSEGYTVACPFIDDFPVVNFVSVINTRWNI